MGPAAALRRFSNARGEGKFFTFDVLDAQGGEIRVYGWNDAVRATQFF
jgi:replication factor A1